MPISVYGGPLPVYAHSIEVSRPGVVVSYGAQTEHRATRSSRTWRRFPYAWAGLTGAEKSAMDAFFIGIGLQRDSFLWRDPSPDAEEPFTRTAIALGTAVAAQVVFSLPTGASEYAGDYPLSPATLYSDGVKVATTTVQTDDRTLTANSAPGVGKVITADYPFYRRVRLESGLTWARDDSGRWGTSLVFREVPA